jgi:preprotein translocase subunit SecY
MTGEAMSSEALIKIAVPLSVIFLVGIVAWAIQRFAL